METTTMENTWTTQDFAAKINGVTKSGTLFVPTVAAIAEGMQDEKAAGFIQRMVEVGLRGFARNNLKAGRPLWQPEWADIIKLADEAAQAKGGAGESLANAKEALAAFKAFLENAGASAKAVEKAVYAASSAKALSLADDKLLDFVQRAVSKFAENLSDEEAVKYASFIDRVLSAQTDDDDDLDNLF